MDAFNSVVMLVGLGMVAFNSVVMLVRLGMVAFISACSNAGRFRNG